MAWRAAIDIDFGSPYPCESSLLKRGWLPLGLYAAIVVGKGFFLQVRGYRPATDLCAGLPTTPGNVSCRVGGHNSGDSSGDSVTRVYLLDPRTA